MIAFNQIGQDIRDPGVYTEVSASRQGQGVPLEPLRVLLCGTKLSTGTLAELTIRRLNNADEGVAWAGEGSMAAEMIRAFKSANPRVETHLILIDELSGGTAQVQTITVTTSSAKAGTLNIYIGGIKVPVAVTAGMAQNSLASAINAAINAKTILPVTSGVSTNVATVTTRWKGAQSVDIRVSWAEDDRTPQGVTVAIAETVPGAGNPDFTEIVTALGDQQFERIVNPWNDSTNLGLLENELLRRWGGMVQKEGLAISAIVASFTDSQTLSDARNSEFNSLCTPGPCAANSWVFAAVAAAVDTDVNASDRSRSRLGRLLPGILAPARSARFMATERESLLRTGGSTFKFDDAGKVYFSRQITTYQVNAQSTADTTYLDFTTMTNLLGWRYGIRAIIDPYLGWKLVPDGEKIASGVDAISPRVLAGFVLVYAEKQRELAHITDIEQFKRDLVAAINEADPDRVDMLAVPNLVNTLYVAAVKNTFIR